MADKLQSEIIKIELDDATFKGSNAFFTPTYVNFFFGNNGTGKSTIAKAIKSGTNVTYADHKRPEDYITLIYNQDFIDENMQSYHELKGIFTFDEVNKDIQDEIDRINGQLAESRKKKTAAETAKSEAEGKLTELDDKSMRNQYTALKILRDNFSKLIPSRYNSSKSLIPEVRRHMNKQPSLSLQEMKMQYDAIYGSDAKEYHLFPTIQDTMVLDSIEGEEILRTAIVNTSQTEMAQFLERIGATQWMRQAHETFHGNSEGRCPYCTRELQPDFEQIFLESFDDQYEKNLEKINAFLNEYRNRANTLFVHMSKLPEEVYPGADEKLYREKLAVLKSAISENIEVIKSKIDEPAKKVILVEVTSILDDISDMITAINNMIKANNEAYNAKTGKAEVLRENLFCHMASELIRDFRTHDQSRKMILDSIEAQKKIIKTQTDLNIQLKDRLRGKKGSAKDTSIAMKKINDMLRDANFQGFELRPHMDPSQVDDNGKPINYEVVRTSTGKVAEDLSEGEKNFIAFLYFLQKVFGNEGSTEDTREKIVVIDDPVSSMDSSTLFIVGEQIRKMVEVCRNNADNRDAVMKGDFIKQIFILTHNAYFHREVTYPHADRYEFVSFYLIRKIDNHSTVRLCDKQNPDEPTARINVNPVKNSYAALWEEYKEVSSAVPLMNAIRRILEYYFIQLCGYEGSNLRKTILEDNKDAFTHDELGNEDNTRYDMASTMLSYIDATSYGVNDGLHYVDDGMDVEMYRETFRMIFEHMHQEQHYNMMMGIKKGRS